MATAAVRRNAATSAPASTRTPVKPPADSVSLSDSARALSSASKSVSGSNEVREDRVAALKAAIANGTYSVSSRALAQKMVDTALG